MATVVGKSSGYLQKRETETDLKIFIAVVFIMSVAWLSIELWPIVLSQFSKSTVIVISFGILLLTLFIKILTDGLENTGKKWASGHTGENEAEKFLRQLSDVYVVFRDVRLDGKGNIDFVVVGPNGVFAVEVKNHAGAIGFDGSVLTRNGRPFPEKNLLMQAMNQSFQIRDYLTKRVGYQVFITPILVFTHKYAKVRFGLTPIKGVMVVRKESLQQAILGAKGTLSPDLMPKIVEALQETVTI